MGQLRISGGIAAEVADVSELEEVLREQGRARIFVDREEVATTRSQIRETLSGMKVHINVGKERRGPVSILVRLKEEE